MKKTLILLISISIISHVQSLKADISSGKYGVSQVFDVQRSPAFPVANTPFTISNFQLPYGNGQDQSGQYTIAANEYIQFTDIDPAANTCSYEINLYDAGGFVRRITSGGDIYGLGTEGFLHTSNPGGFGTFISNAAGYSLGSSLTYTPTTALATCAEVEAYVATTEPLADGETAATIVSNPQPIPVLGGVALFISSGLLGLLGFLRERGRKHN